MNQKKYTFCLSCEQEVPYSVKKELIEKNIRGKNYQFEITEAYCDKCGKKVTPQGLIDKNVEEIDEQYRQKEGIVSVEDIKNLSQIYDIGKEPLSLALGFGQSTINRYLMGQVPSKEYSDIMRHALASPDYMKSLLDENKEKLSPTAYEKAKKSADKLSQTMKVPNKTRRVIAKIFEKLEEVTPLLLQKLLYYIQGISSVINNKMIFKEDCEAWVHGPVYPNVYKLFKDFKYNPIDDERFGLIKWSDAQLNHDEEQIVDLVTDTFGQYGGKVLEQITHQETPWREARNGYEPLERSNEIISKKQIKNYFTKVNERFDLSSENGINEYINDMRKLAQ